MNRTTKSTLVELARLFLESAAYARDNQLGGMIGEMLAIVFPGNEMFFDFSDASPPDIESQLSTILPLLADGIENERLTVSKFAILLDGQELGIRQLEDLDLRHVPELDFLSAILRVIRAIPGRQLFSEQFVERVNDLCQLAKDFAVSE